MTSKNSLMELAGILSDEDADKLEKHIKELRASSRKRVDRIRRELQDL